jgi:hypothetical protein
MDSNTITDCLVLKIQEHDLDTNDLDTTLYVLYDKKEHHFVVRGQRNHKTLDNCTYSFNCEFAEELAEFITFVICKKNLWTYVLYNYDNLPYSSDDITYDFLLRHDSPEYELGGYSNLDFSRKYLLKKLRMLRNVFNNYK